MFASVGHIFAVTVIFIFMGCYLSQATRDAFGNGNIVY